MLSSKISDIKNAKYNKKLVKSFGIGCTFLLKYTSEGWWQVRMRNVMEGKVRTLIDGLRSLEFIPWTARANGEFVITCG